MGKPHSAEYTPPYDFVLVSAAAPGSDVDLPENCCGLLIGTPGAISVVMENGSQRDSLPAVQGINPGYFTRVLATGTTAENIWAVL